MKLHETGSWGKTPIDLSGRLHLLPARAAELVQLSVKTIANLTSPGLFPGFDSAISDCAQG